MTLHQKLIFTFLILSCLLIAQPIVYGQGCCSGGAPLSGNLAIANMPARTLSVRLIYDNNNLSDLLAKDRELDDKTRKRLSNSILLRLNYSLNQRIAFTALLGYSNQIEKVDFLNFSSRSQGHGFGDVIFLGQYNFINNNTNGLSAAVGVKLPTGSINRINEETGLALAPDLQPGTGAIDYLFSSQYARSNLFNRNIGVLARLTYTLSTPAERLNNQQTYEFGNELQLFAGLNNNFFLKKSILSPQLTLNYRHTAFDKTNDIRTANTGGHWFYLSLSLLYTLNQNLSFFTQGTLPLYRNLDGVQLTTSYRITTSINYTFTFKNPVKVVPIF